MKIKKVLESRASYPIRSAMKPIIFTAATMVALSGCGSSKLSPHKIIKPEVPIHANADKNSTNIEEQEPTGGIPPVQPLPAPK